jgi:hypothetical protein
MGKRISVVVASALLTVATAFVFRPDGPTVKEVGMNRTTTSGDGTTIAYTKLGSGPPLIIVDGAFCYRENGPASQLAPLLAKHFTVFAYDRRGRGASGDAREYAIEREVDDLRSMVREAGGSALAVGISSLTPRPRFSRRVVNRRSTFLERHPWKQGLPCRRQLTRLAFSKRFHSIRFHSPKQLCD